MININRFSPTHSYLQIVVFARWVSTVPMVAVRASRRRWVHAVMFTMVLVLGGCFRGLLYEGDGRFVDHGPTAAVERYLLDLGSVDLATKSEQRYSMAGLPPVEMVVGLEVTAAFIDERFPESRPVDALIQIVLVNSRNELVIRERERLARWAWAGPAAQEFRAFVYRRGDVREQSLGSGVIGFERLGVRTDGGWGSYFQPRRGERYLLTFSILEPASVGHRYSVRLLVKGGGWKT